eukprot:CAMPEP_0115431274 /NCGR_PEP_ID=MMETSP0271-20121206/31485_1 /TAXON_ID=71861 /ORGANISM="Scrippsiella trochoidea, Strain CCMP3099" /LENGTH=445 /DNA_ID=CAMNT_0002856547 /DNA_START=52 /DNA_END=1386 /DNA_ORIENTATION=-
MAGADAMEAIRSMESLCDLIADTLRQPCSGEESKAMVEDLFRECEKQRPKLEEIAMAVIGQENGEKTFNEITAALDRFERLQEQKEAWVHASPRAGGGGGGGMQMSPAPPQALSGSGAFGGMPFGAMGDDMAAAGMPPQPSPIMSQAASSAGDFENLQQRTSGSDLMKKDKKKKEKKEKKRKSDGTDEFGFLPPASNGSLAPMEGGAAASSAFGAWPPSNSQQLDAEPSGSGAWGTSGAGLGAGGADAAWPSAAASGGDGGGGFGSWGAPSAAAGTSGPAGGADTFDAFAADATGAWGASVDVTATAPTAAPAAAAAAAPPPTASVLSIGGAADGLGAGSNSAGFGTFGEPVGGAGVQAAPPLESLGGAAQDPGWHMDIAGMAEGSGTNGKPQPASGIRRGSPQQATLHIQRPFREVEQDKKGFEKLFTTEVAKALGVPSHRIRV